MALGARGLLEYVSDSGLGPLGGIHVVPELARDLVGAFKSDSPDIRGQCVGVLLDHLDRPAFISLIDLQSHVRADSKSLEENHHVADLAVFFPAVEEHLDSFFSESFDFAQFFRFFLDCPNQVHAESIN